MAIQTQTSSQTQTPVTGANFQDILAQLLEKIGSFEGFDPADLFNQLSEGSPFLAQLSQALADSFQPFVQQQLSAVGDQFRATGNESALSGTGGPNRLTQVAIPQALASINQQFGGQLTGLVSSALGDLLGANQLQQQGNLGLIDQLNRALGTIPTGQQTNASQTTSGDLFRPQGNRGAGSSSVGLSSLFQSGGGHLQPKTQFNPFAAQSDPNSPFFISRSPKTGPGPNNSGRRT